MIPRKKFKSLILSISLVMAVLWGSIVQAETNQQESNFVSPIVVVNASFLNVRVGPGVQYAVLVTAVGGTELPVLGVAPDRVWYQVATDAGAGWVNIEFTLPRGDFTNVPLVRYEATDINAGAGQGGGGIATSATVVTSTPLEGIALLGSDLRQEPRDGAINIRSALPPDPNTIYPIQGRQSNTDGDWYLINVPNIGTGWVNKAELRPLECGTNDVVVLNREEPLRFDGLSARSPYLLPRGTEAYFRGFLPDNISAYIELVGGDLGVVASTSIDARSDSIVSLCNDLPTTTVNIQTAVTTNPGQGGGFIPPTSAQAISGNHIVINTGYLNIRSGPAVGFSVVATVPGGTELAVVGRANDNVWLLVQGSFGQGWVNSEFTLFRGNYSTVPLIENLSEVIITTATVNSGQGGGSVAPANTIVSANAPLEGIALLGSDLRQEPRDGAINIRSALPPDPNTIYPIQGRQSNTDGDWYLINVPNIGTGWVNKAELRPLECGTNDVVVLNREEPLRFDGLSARSPYLLPRGTEAYFRGFLPDNISAYIELVGGDLGVVASTSIDARSDSIVSLCNDAPFVRAQSATTSSSSATTQSITTSNVSGNRIVVNTGNLNIRSGPLGGFSIVATVPGGTELAVTGVTPDGIWYRVQGSFGEGWANAEFTLFRGNYSTIPVIPY